MFTHIVFKFTLKGHLKSYLKMESTFPNNLCILSGFIKVALPLVPGLIQYAILQKKKRDEYWTQTHLLNFVEIPIIHLIATNRVNHKSA